MQKKLEKEHDEADERIDDNITTLTETILKKYSDPNTPKHCGIEYWKELNLDDFQKLSSMEIKLPRRIYDMSTRKSEWEF